MQGILHFQEDGYDVQKNEHVLTEICFFPAIFFCLIAEISNMLH